MIPRGVKSEPGCDGITATAEVRRGISTQNAGDRRRGEEERRETDGKRWRGKGGRGRGEEAVEENAGSNANAARKRHANASATTTPGGTPGSNGSTLELQERGEKRREGGHDLSYPGEESTGSNGEVASNKGR